MTQEKPIRPAYWLVALDPAIVTVLDNLYERIEMLEAIALAPTIRAQVEATEAGLTKQRERETQRPEA